MLISESLRSIRDCNLCSLRHLRSLLIGILGSCDAQLMLLSTQKGKACLLDLGCMLLKILNWFPLHLELILNFFPPPKGSVCSVSHPPLKPHLLPVSCVHYATATWPPFWPKLRAHSHLKGMVFAVLSAWSSQIFTTFSLYDLSAVSLAFLPSLNTFIMLSYFLCGMAI